MLWINFCSSLIVVNFYLTSCVSFENQISQPGGLFEIDIRYRNNEALLESGEFCDSAIQRCDVYIKLELYALSGQSSRLLFRKKSDTVMNTGEVKAFFQEQVNEKLPVAYRLEIRVYDYDWHNEPDLITHAEGIFQPSPVVTTLHQMYWNHTNPSESFRLSATIKMRCNPNYYGIGCDVFCKPNSWVYKCDINGTKLCVDGRYGDDCEFFDYCKFYPCPKYARCKNLPKEYYRRCMCKNFEGDGCFTYYSCDRSPCKNGGQCALLKDIVEFDNNERQQKSVLGDSTRVDDYSDNEDDETVCICPDNWKGQFCTEPVVDCTTDSREYRNTLKQRTTQSCLNGGVCIIHPGNSSARCSCPPEWEGYFCEASKEWSIGKKFGVAFGVIFIIFFILSVAFLTWLCCLSRPPKVPKRQRQPYPAITYTPDYPYIHTKGLRTNTDIQSKVFMRPNEVLQNGMAHHESTDLNTFGKPTSSTANPLKMQNDYEIPFEIEGINHDKMIDRVEFDNSRYKPNETLAESNSMYSDENIYVNYNDLMLQRQRDNLSCDSKSYFN
uniref:Delta-like protein n=1 Tax=Trichobilharzia regenti TaxID=157069 RepID=A0AA85K1D2_TRIRE|nr:unnamed protein product [Trichobilharzia regenti]